MAAPKQYEITVKSAMQWAAAELEHVGRIASLADPDLQYAYAMSTLNGMAHLKDALYELLEDSSYENHRADIQKTHDAVVRTMKHLKAAYNLDLDAIRAFNTRGTLSDMSYLETPENEAQQEEGVGNAGNVGNVGNVGNARYNGEGGRRRTRYRSRRNASKRFGKKLKSARRR